VYICWDIGEFNVVRSEQLQGERDALGKEVQLARQEAEKLKDVCFCGNFVVCVCVCVCVCVYVCLCMCLCLCVCECVSV